MKKNKIMVLTCSLNVGGAEKHIHSLVSHMDQQRFNFAIVCLYDLGAIGEDLFKNNQNVSVYHNMIKNKYDVFGIINLIRVMRAEKVDILFIVHTPLTLFWGVLCAKLTGIKVSVTRSPTTQPTAHVKRRRIVNYFILKYVDKIIAQAYSQRDYLVNYDSADSKKIQVIHNGVDIGRFSKTVDDASLRKAVKIPLDASVVGIVARLAPQKGLYEFLRAARIVVDAFPDVYFLIVGDGGERRNLEQLSQELSIQNNVLFLGMVQDVSQIIPLFDVAVLSSRPVGETFSNAILEYMAASKAVVATNVGSLAEQVIDGKTGFLVPYGDTEALADAVIKLLKDINLAKKMGMAGRAMVKEQFTIEKMIATYESLFSDLLEQAPLK